MNKRLEVTQNVGKQIAVVTTRNGKKIELYLEDYEYLMGLGLSPAWNLSPKGYVSAPAYRAKGGQIGVARVLLDAGPGDLVRYYDGNPSNLRRENLSLAAGVGWSTRRDRDFLTPKNRKHGRRADAR